MTNSPATQAIGNTALSTVSAVTTTSNVSPNPSDLFIVALGASCSTAFTDTTTVSGMGLTWTKVLGVVSGIAIITFFIGYGSAPTFGAITITLSRSADFGGRYTVIRVPNSQNGTNPVAASGTTNGTGTSGTKTITSVAGGDARISVWAFAAAEAVTPDSTGLTWVENVDSGTTGWTFEVQQVNGHDNTNTAAWTSSVFYGGWVAQLQLAGSATKYTDTPYKAHPYRGQATEETEEGTGGVWAVYQ